MQRISILLIQACFFLASSHIWAQNNTIPQLDKQSSILLGSSIVSNATISITPRESNAANRMLSGVKNKVQEANIFIRLDLGDEFVEKDNCDFEHQVEVLVTKTYSDGSTENKSGITLTVSNDGDIIPEVIYPIDILADLSSTVKLNQYQVKVVSNNSLSTCTDYTPHLRLNVSHEIRYGIDVRNGSNVLAQAPILSSINSPQTSRVMMFNWTGGENYPNYELQVLKLENSNPTMANNSQSIQAIVDWNKALKLETGSHQKQQVITIGEGSGFYIWRVRGIGNYYPNGVGNASNFGKWSSAPSNGNVLNLNKNALTLTGAFYLDDPDENINWIFNRVYSEGDNNFGTRRAESMTYADGLNNARQNQTYISSKGDVIANQTILDYSGRPAVNTIPVPVGDGNNQGIESYYKNLAIDGSGQLYKANNFDTDNKLSNPDQIAGAKYSNYYGSGSTDESVPSANGYPYSRTIFTTDGSGRPQEQSMPGRRHAIGEQSSGKGRTTRYLYVSPTEKELIRLFGMEAPKASSVVKTIQIDPNNIATVTYTSISGKVLATSTAKYGENLAQDNLTTNSYSITNTTNESVLKDRKFFSSRRVALPVTQDVTIGYTFHCNTPDFGCASGDCSYTLKLSITNIATGNTYFAYPTSTATLPHFAIDLSNCSNNQIQIDLSNAVWKVPGLSPLTTNSSGGVVTLPAGEYLISKEISSGLDVNIGEITANSSSTEIGPIVALVSDWMSAVNDEDSHQDFETKLNQLLTDISNAHAAANPSSSTTVDYTTNAYQAHFDAIRTAHSDYFTQDYLFNPDVTLAYSPSATTSNNPGSLSFQSGCCSSSAISIPKPQKCIPCETIESKRDAGTLVPQDMALFTDYLDQKVNSADKYTTACPGFTEGTLQYMLANMIKSNYHTGPKIKVGNDWYKAEQNASGVLERKNFAASGAPLYELITTNNKYNYDVEELYKCWTLAVDIYYDLNDNKLSNTDVFQTASDNEGSGTINDHFDDNAGGGGGVIGFVTSLAISLKTANFSAGSGMAKADRIRTTFDIVSRFMDCAGYQFYEIIDENTPADILSQISQEYQYVGVSIPAPTGTGIGDPFSGFSNFSSFHGSHWIEIADVLTTSTEKGLYYPYILRPEWMFKYFTYNTHNYIGTSNPYNGEDFAVSSTSVNNKKANDLLPRHIYFEQQFHYDDLVSLFPGGPTNYSQMCVPVDATYNSHRNWSSAQRYSMYKMIAGMPIDPQVNNNEMGQSTLCSSVDMSLYEKKRDAMIENAKNTCDARRDEFYSEIMQTLQENCWEVTDCPSESYQLTYMQVEAMVDAAIARCKSAIQDEVDTPAPPVTCVQKSGCFKLLPDGTWTQVNDVSIVLLESCYYDKMQAFETWDVELATDVQAQGNSNCSPNATQPTWWSNSTIHECTQGTDPYNETTSTTYTVNP